MPCHPIASHRIASHRISSHLISPHPFSIEKCMITSQKKNHTQKHSCSFYYEHLSHDDVLTRQEGYNTTLHMKEWVWTAQGGTQECKWSSLRTDAYPLCLTVQRAYSSQGIKGFSLLNPSCPATSIRAPNGCFISGDEIQFTYRRMKSNWQ